MSNSKAKYLVECVLEFSCDADEGNMEDLLSTAKAYCDYLVNLVYTEAGATGQNIDVECFPRK